MRLVYGITLFVCFCTTSLFAQLRTTNDHVGAVVEGSNNQGLITIRLAPGTVSVQALSFPQKSFLSVKIGEKIYTNNTVGANLPNDPRIHEFLSGGITKKTADTIRTTWTKSNCTIIQDVYPVDLGSHGQIVMRWSITNDSAGTVTAAVQFLLDLQLGNQLPTDGSIILTRYGYNNIWETFRPDTAEYRFGIPSFYSTFSSALTALGYTRDVDYKLGLREPARMSFGDWGEPLGSSLVDNLWGTSPSAPWISKFNDSGVLFEWDSVVVMQGQTVELGSMSYGTGKFNSCNAMRSAALFLPDHLVNKAGSLVPDTFEVNAFVFNVFLQQQQNTKSMTLQVGPHLRILSPDTGNIDQKVQRQLMEPTAGYIGDNAALTASWKVVADMPDCKGSVQSWVKVVADSIKLGGSSDTCEHTITIDCSNPLAVYEADGDDKPLEIAGNPSKGTTTARLTLRTPEEVTLRILDVSGRTMLLRSLGTLLTGINDVLISTDEYPEGTYYVIAEWGGRQYAKKLQVIK